jgi:hypothetical protein
MGDQPPGGADLNNEFSNIVNLLNSLNEGVLSWSNLKGTTLTPLANIAMGGFKLTGLGAGTTNGDSLRYEQLIGLYLLLSGGTMSGPIAMGTSKITGLGNGSAAQDAAAFGQLISNNIKGTTTNDNATAGNIGEYVSATTGFATNFPATNVFGDGTSMSLTAGDWNVDAVLFVNNQGVTTTDIEFGISQTTGNSTTGLVVGDNYVALALGVGTSLQHAAGNISGYRQSLASTTTIYLKVMATYTGTTPTYGCRLSARRMR